MEVLDEEFRKIGFTEHARKFPLSDAAVSVRAEFNGVEPHTLKGAWRFAPNAFVKYHLEWLGAEKLAGRSIWNGDRLRIPLTLTQRNEDGRRI